tara:strand:+ start:7166 stop:9334 length:2169 start_codon:yes stop_codon:yes gene_type:complete
MKQEKQPEPAVSVPKWSTPNKAREQLDREIDRFISAVVEATGESDAALAMRVTAGLGKTATALRVISRYGQGLLARGHVLIYVPTLDLAERAHADFCALAPGLPSRVIRGRDALRPDERAKKMCDRADIARKISGFVPSVTQALCRGQDPNGAFIHSPCALKCPYLEQKDVRGPHVVFLSHAYLTVDAPVDRDYPVALRVIDEKVWPTLISTSNLSIDDFMRAPPRSFPESLHDELCSTKAAIVDGLQRDLPLHDHLCRSGIDTERLLRLAQAEGRARNYLEIGPWQSVETVRFRVKTFDEKSFIASRQRQKILERLAERETGHCVGLKLSELPTDHGSQRVAQSSSMRKIDRDAPLLLLDADADPDITQRIAPGAEFVTIQSPPVADIVQISDLTLSKSCLLHSEFGALRLTGVLKILKREIENAAEGGVLVVATKAVLRALHAQTGRLVGEQDEEGLRKPLLGAEPRWFGPRIQGVNDFEKFAAIVVIGRLQPGITDIERSARAVFAQDTTPIEPYLAGPLPAAIAKIILANGSISEAIVRAHPDPRAHAILAQSRECATLQAIARLRLVSPNRRKRVVILSNLPLKDFPVTRLSTFAALERDLEHEPDWRGFLRIEKALCAAKGRPVRGARLSAAGLADDLPCDFKTEAGAKRFRRGRTTAQLMSLCQRVAAANNWPITLLSLRNPGGGKAVPAVIFDDRAKAKAIARALWPSLTPHFV